MEEGGLATFPGCLVKLQPPFLLAAGAHERAAETAARAVGCLRPQPRELGAYRPAAWPGTPELCTGGNLQWAVRGGA